MICLIVVNSIGLALDSPLNNPKDSFYKNLQIVDYVLTFLFTFEAIIKIIAFGFYNCGSKSYILNSWNILDFLVILITVRDH